MLHLVDRFVLLVLLQAIQAPVAEHASVQELLIDRRELVLQNDVQMPQDLRIALHSRRSNGIYYCSRDLGRTRWGTQHDWAGIPAAGVPVRHGRQSWGIRGSRPERR